MAPHLTSFCSQAPPSFPNSAICRTPPWQQRVGVEAATPLPTPPPCPSELSRHARGRSSPALGSKLHCLMVQWGAGPPVSPALGLPHHAHLPPLLQVFGWGEAPKGDRRPAIWSHKPVNHSSLRLERVKARYIGPVVGGDCAVCVVQNSNHALPPPSSYRSLAGGSPPRETRGRQYGHKCP